MKRVCPACRLDIVKTFPEVEGRLCPSCYKKNVGACMICDASPVEIIEFHRVLGLLILGFSGSKTIVACAGCTRRLVLKSLLYTAFLGWIGFLPFYRSFRGQIANLRSLFKHPSVNPALRLPLTALAFAGPIIALTAAMAALILYLPAGSGGGTAALPSALAEEYRLNGDGELAAGHYDLAEAWFRKAAAEAPDFPPARLGLGRAVEMQGRIDEAEREYRRALAGAEGMSYPQLRQSLARLLMKKGEPAQAASILKPEIDWDEKLSHDLLDMHRLYQDACVRSGGEAAAATLYGMKAAQSKESAAAQYLFGRIAARSDAEVARARFSSALEKDAKFFPAAYALCRLEIAQGRPAAALAAAEQALAARQGDRNALFSKAEALLLASDVEAAGKILLGMHFDVEGGGSPLSAVGKAMAANATADFENAARFASAAAASKGPAAALAGRELGIALGASGRTEEALEALREAMESTDDPDIVSECAAWAAQITARTGGKPDELWRKAAAGQGWPGLAGKLWSGAMPESDYLAIFDSGGYPAWSGHGYYFAGLRRKLAGDGAGAVELMSKASAAKSGLIRFLAGKQG